MNCSALRLLVGWKVCSTKNVYAIKWRKRNTDAVTSVKKGRNHVRFLFFIIPTSSPGKDKY